MGYLTFNNMNKPLSHQHIFDRYHLQLAKSIIEDLPPFEMCVNPKDENFDKPLSEIKLKK